MAKHHFLSESIQMKIEDGAEHLDIHPEECLIHNESAVPNCTILLGHTLAKCASDAFILVLFAG